MREDQLGVALVVGSHLPCLVDYENKIENCLCARDQVQDVLGTSHYLMGTGNGHNIFGRDANNLS